MGNITEINDIKAYLKEHENKQLLRFITCGSVDDGKSTLIGRLLHDSKVIFEDQLASIKKDSKKSNTTENEFDLSLLVDGLQSEREQGITIDVAYRYFSTPKRKFIIADTPGHEQYTRNMATGASTANLAIILIDARYGVQTQTRRHTFINKLLGIKEFVIAINKMDLVGFDQEIFNQIKDDYLNFAKELEVDANITIIPLSALNGDNIVNRSYKSPWYKGLTLMEHLESVNIENSDDFTQFSFPVQYVNRPNLDFRGFCGTIASGDVQVGDKIKVLPSNKISTIKTILTSQGAENSAFVNQAITLTLNDEIDISRGDLIVKEKSNISCASGFDVDIVWLNEENLKLNRQYIIKRATTTTLGSFSKIVYKTDVNSLEKSSSEVLNLNEIAKVKLELEQDIAFTKYNDNKTLGSFIVIDKISNNTVGAGMIRDSFENKKEVEDKKRVYTAFEIELNALIRKHYPEWESKEIF